MAKSIYAKIRRITRPRFANWKIIADSWIIRVWTYQIGPRVIQLESKLNTCILDEYGKY